MTTTSDDLDALAWQLYRAVERVLDDADAAPGLAERLSRRLREELQAADRQARLSHQLTLQVLA